MKSRLFPSLAVLLLAGVPIASLSAQQDGVTRTELIRHDLGETGREVIQVRVDLAPGVMFPAHSHPGEEIAYVIEGTLLYRLAGRPPVTLQPGESLFIPAGVVHTAENVGDVNAGELATYIVAKDRPIIEFHPDSAASN